MLRLVCLIFKITVRQYPGKQLKLKLFMFVHSNKKYEKHLKKTQSVWCIAPTLISKSNTESLVHSFNLKSMKKLEALRERRPPWPRQIITLILPTVKMLSLGCERLPTPLKKKKKKRFWIITCTTIWICYHYYVFFCSFTHLTIPRSPPKFNQFFLILLRTRP